MHSTANLPPLAILNKSQAFFEKPIYISKKTQILNVSKDLTIFSLRNLGYLGNLNLGNFCNLGKSQAFLLAHFLQCTTPARSDA